MNKEFQLTLDDVGSNGNQNIETLFALANGFLGVRASLPIAEEGCNAGSFVNGFYETSDITYGENAYGYAKQHQTMVKLFDFRTIELKINDCDKFTLSSRQMNLDMGKGVLQEKYVYTTSLNQEVQIEIESFASHKNRSVYAQKWRIMPLNFSGTIGVNKQAVHIQPNKVREDDPRKKESSAALQIDEEKVQTKNSGQILYYRFDDYQSEKLVEIGEEISFVQCYEMSKTPLSSIKIDYEVMKEAQQTIFQDFWSISDIELEGNVQLQKGIRFNLFHLFSSAGRDGKTNFSAKGLTGEGYEGHYFWDTEMYLLPFFIFTQPEIAKSLLQYRRNILPKAKERASELGYKGALFTWRTINGEETSAYYPAGTAQLHINADIAYAFELYEKVTGDTKFLSSAKDVLYETARFWLDYGFYSKRGFELHEVTGPDEYTALVNNNYYTNQMAKNNLYYAVKLANQYQEYVEEAVDWKKAADAMFVGYDEEKKLTKQDDSFLEKEKWHFEQTPKEKYPLLLHYHPMKIYKYQVLKQADVLLAHMLFPRGVEQEKRDFDYYEPLTTHDSSLSKAIYGVVASRIGYEKKAYDFFKESAIMDLEDTHENANHGIHAANMGGCWLGLIYGFAGLRVEGEEIVFHNHLPKEFTSLKFRYLHKGNVQEVVLTQDEKTNGDFGSS